MDLLLVPLMGIVLLLVRVSLATTLPVSLIFLSSCTLARYHHYSRVVLAPLQMYVHVWR